MARSTSMFVCQNCGVTGHKWSGRCESCESWNTIVEEPDLDSSYKRSSVHAAKRSRVEFHMLTGATEPAPRRSTGIVELDRVTGGGLVPGSALLIGGDPGIGKSTLLIQTAAKLAATTSTLYISGEEAIDQVRMRALRLGIAQAPVKLASATAVRDILAAIKREHKPDVIIIDSIQTMYVDALDSAPGTVAQVRASAQELIRTAKICGFTLILVGHVTKDGMIAGPRVLEHMVDSVLYFEGERGHQFRILRTVKNRFGPTDEIGVFEMTGSGLTEVANPSALFLAERRNDVPGSAVFAGMEGTRPLLVEIQALVATSSLGTPRRTVVGWDSGRLAMVLAVLEAHCDLSFSNADVYLNVAGGLKVIEPAADLAVAAALISSAQQVPIPLTAVVFGEIGLSGEIRNAGQTDARLKEAERLGFKQAIMPYRRGRGQNGIPFSGLKLTEIDQLSDLVVALAPINVKKRIRKTL